MTLASLAPADHATENIDYSDYPTVAPLFRRFAELTDDAPERAVLREQLVFIHLPLAEHLARRFARRGEPTVLP
ncbi:hypothetical protein [Cryptosporangium arvum]|uniref:hypothetical protein n=1 Tax=Cryptosporangium arvum TaxID=80871 RepID=UPI0004BBB6FF|nr:hypothetical protein [Cryptosporangium arvum]